MNYITNYYKNLSEQLQAQVNHLEREVRMINEAIASYQPMAGAIQQGNISSVTNRETNPGSGGGEGYSPEVQGVLSSWGQSNSTYDYNGDGVVDGLDLGIALNMAFGQGSGTNPTAMRSTQFGTNNQTSQAGNLSQGQFVSGAGMRRPTQSGGGRFNPTASMGGANAFANAGRPTQGGGSPFTGDINGDGVVDGADLGLALGGQAGGNYQGVLQNWGMPASANQYVPTTTQQRRPRRTVR